VNRIPCPYCSQRNSSEFRHVGELRQRPDPANTSIQEWRSYLYEQANPAGWTNETWYHAMGCRRFIQVERHTLTNEIRSAQPANQGRAEAVLVAAATVSAVHGSTNAGGQP
jgi:heterotetrameric sarcosine oxidase delta subunit